ncbi:MAG: hypothetical protein NVSMB44_37890 [Ktedonobacteraceae bacterium]
MRDINNEDSLMGKRSARDGSRTWEGRLGRRRFRVQWDRERDAARIRFQAPFTVDNDPDGVGVPFTPDLGFVWERGRPAHVFGRYAERLNKAQQEAPAALERVVGELENTLATLRENLKQRAEARSLQKSQASRRSSAQRVRIEYEQTPNPLDEDLTESGDEQAFDIASGERESRRRTILEAFRAGTISLEETEQQLNELG